MPFNPERKREMRDTLSAINKNAKQFIKLAEEARADGDITENSLKIIEQLAVEMLMPITTLTFGLISNYVDGDAQAQHDLTKPVADSELPDWNLVTTDVPDN